MATSDEFRDYILGQLNGLKNVKAKKMFGDVCLYCNGVVVGLICDNELYIKKTEASPPKELETEKANPYEGAAEHYRVGAPENKESFADFVRETLERLPKDSAKDKPYDFKKEQKSLYRPGKRPMIIEVPKMNYVAVRGEGNPNDPDGEYKEAMEALYGIAFTLRMSRKSGHSIEGYFEYVVPPLEGLWWQDKNKGSLDFDDKESFKWISMIRLPDFVTPDEFEWAKGEAQRKKGKDFSNAEFFSYSEGICAQCEHVGSYDNEAETIDRLIEFARKEGYKPALEGERRHHEIYLSDPRRCKPENLRTVIRIPLSKA